MAENSNECTHDCSSCGASCSSRQGPPPREAANKGSRVRRIIGVVSGKGGVGKSLVTGLCAVGCAREGRSVAVLDADITGPSVPEMFGLTGDIVSDGDGSMSPLKTDGGIGVISLNLFLEHPDDPVVWRGPVIAGTVRQFWTDVAWGDVDFMFVDMPPGTGDVPLTVFQSLPLDGVVIVTTPQELVGMIVSKAVKMAAMMNIPVLGVVENLSFITCPDCGREIRLFGESHIDRFAATYGIPVLARLPIDPALAALCDSGEIEKTVSEAPAILAKAVIDATERLKK